ncbi:MAG: hypothetical protein JW953_06590 [Anaerolineae bacterium]|nr:hypothetical protein [Anaerolineae bacterium]
MNLRNKLGITIFAQLFGVGSTVLTNIIIAQRYGPEGQGFLTTYRSGVDFLTNIGLFGFPQAFVFMINSKMIKTNWAVKFSASYSLLFGGVVLGLGSLLYALGVRELSGFNVLTILAIIVAATGMLLHGMYRAISLSVKPIQVYNLVSVMPAVFALLIYFLWYAENYQILVLGLVFAGAISACLSAFVLKEHLFFKQRDGHNLSKVIEATRYGFWSFIPGIAFSFVAMATYTLLRQGGKADEIAGYFSISYLLVSTVILPLNMIIPVLFDTWSKETDQKYNLQSYLKLSHLGTVMAVAGSTIGMLLVKPMTILVFGLEFSPSALSTQILLLSVYALYQNRLLSAMLLALGQPAVVGIGALIRAAIILPLLFWGEFNSHLGAASLWTIGEFINMIYMLILVCRRTGWVSSQVAGLSLPWIFENLKHPPIRT